MTLEDYLADQCNRDLQDVAAIERALDGVANVFVAAFDKAQGCWPYELKSGESDVVGKPSQGTSAMILAAIGKMLGSCTLRDGSTSEPLPDLPEEMKGVFGAGAHALAEQLRQDGAIRSGTFGDNDPLTISHITEFVRSCGKSTGELESVSTALNSLPQAKSTVDSLLSESPSREGAFRAALGPNWCARNAFVALRIARSYADFSGISSVKAPTYREFFESQLHDHLSFSSIPDSRFDPAELAFCLEGLLLCAREAVDPVLFARVCTVLAAEQETSAYWRPNRPFRSEPTGAIILPLSVEGANSFLRSVEIMDGNKLHGTFAATAVPMLRRFWQWLSARQVEFNALHTSCTGWHSEHINQSGVIHLWDTSQVVEFLLAFRRLLQRHIARETLVLSGVKIDDPKRADWTKLTATYEPLQDETIAPRVFDRIRAEFVEPWSAGMPDKNHSMLLYGPPGTGKTNVAKSLANTLGLRLLTITVSDFLGTGGALVEARAKAIFEMLKAQTRCIIFFDEIDAFLLDRDSEHYRRQDTLFQFLTPGMLTKLNDLRTVGRSIFIIATNYANRIDPAIKRPGRIDRQYLLLPPDYDKRKQIIADLLKEDVAEDEISGMARASLHLGYKEIVGAVEQAKIDSSFLDIVQALERAPRSSSPRQYLDRLEYETAFPVDEFVAMVKMAAQADRLHEIKDDLESLKREDRTREHKLAPALERAIKGSRFEADLANLGIEV